jgi:outer membrane protein assembly factor BamD
MLTLIYIKGNTVRWLILAICLALASCATERPQGKTEAEVLYKEAQDLIKDSRYILATEKLNTLRSQYPYSFYATHAELLQADVLFAQENYAEAAAAYILFKDFHPRYKDLGYVVWRTAESFYKQIPDTIDRDLSSAFEAVKYYQELLNFHSGSEYVKGAIEKVKLCESMILGKEKYIGDFYFKTEVFDAARYRYLNIISQYKNHHELVAHAMIRVLVSSAKLREKDECQKYYNDFRPRILEKDRERLDNAHKTCMKL